MDFFFVNHIFSCSDLISFTLQLQCYSTADLLAAYDIDLQVGMTEDQLKEISSALMQQVAVGCQPADEEQTERTDKLTTAQSKIWLWCTSII